MNKNVVRLMELMLALCVGALSGSAIFLGLEVRCLHDLSRLQTGYESRTEGTDPSCDYNAGTKNAQGLSTCNVDYKTKVHGDQGKTINVHCDNGYVESADMVSSDDICFDNKEDNEQNFFNCADLMSEGYCGWKWQNGCATNHHVTTKTITCAPQGT